MPVSTGLTFGHYEVLERLGTGGMGEVYRARDQLLGRFVAIKALPPEFSRDPERLARFVHEAKILASLNHSRIGAIYGIEDLPTGDRCLILELVSGISLSERLRRSRPELRETLRLCAGIAEALEAAHECGVIHRDLKPGNVMLTDRGSIKVLDFGLARQAAWSDPDRTLVPGQSLLEDAIASGRGTRITGGERIEGTPGYMSPEQIRGEAQDTRTDLFSFGCILFECLAGQAAFRGADPVAIMSSVLEDEPPWSLLPKDMPGSIRGLLERCLEKDVARRLERIEPARQELEKARTRFGVGGAPAPRPANNLPRDLSRFLGRERELAECERLLSETRMLTLAGIGGCGKTRLARALGWRVLDRYPDGVWFVDFAPLTDPERVVTTVASVFGVAEQAGVPLVQALATHLKRSKALLVLDNCEHLLAACADLSRVLLERCGVTLVATSRESLGIEGERVLMVQAMSLPPGRPELHDVAASDAVMLFVERARDVDPGFELDLGNYAAVAEICRELDGIPLAIELAANRIGMLTVEQIRSMLDDRFRLLRAARGATLPRHQTMTAVIQWSYDHLSPGDQRMFRALAVFSGGWTLRAATAVGGQRDEFAALDGLTRIAEKSLITVDRLAGIEARYGMLETVRQYALERLEESNEGSDTRNRHLDYFVSLAVETDHVRYASRRVDWRKIIDQELENLLSAHAWCDHVPGAAEQGLRLAFALRNYWLPRGTLDLGYRISVEALRRSEMEAPTLVRARVLLTAGVLGFFMGRYADGEELLAEALPIVRRDGDRDTLVTTLTALALVAQARKERDTARDCLMEAIELARAAGAWRSLSGALNSLGDLYRSEGEMEKAIAAYEESIATNRCEGTPEDSAIARCNLGRALVIQGDLDRARTILTELLDDAEGLDSNHVLWGVLDVATALACALGRHQLGARVHGAADALLLQSGSRRDEQDDLFLQPFLSSARDSLGAGGFDGAYAAGQEPPATLIVAEVREWVPGALPGDHPRGHGPG